MPARTPENTTRGLISIENADIRLIRIFMHVVEAGGLTAAQTDLNLTLSTISERISTLEQRLGVVLCKRGPGGFQLTDTGGRIYLECQRLFGSLENFSRKVADMRSNLGGSLSVGLIDNTISDPHSSVAKSVAKLVAMAPTLHLTVEMKSPSELLRDVVAHKLDLAIGSFPRISLGLAYLDLYDETQNFYCGVDHPLFAVNDSDITIDHVRSHRIIARSYWATRDLKIFAIATPHATVSNMEAEAFLILSGAYLGYLPDHFADQFVRAGRIRPIRPNMFSYKAKFQIATTEDWKTRPIVKAFVELICGNRT